MGFTLTEKILANASHSNKVYPGNFIVADINYVMAHDSTGPLAMESFSMIGKNIYDTSRVVIVFDHFYPAPSVDAAILHQKSRNFVMENNISNFHVDGVCHQILVEKYVSPGDVVVGADSHTCTQGALGAFTTGLGSTDVGGVIATGKCWFRIPESLRFNLTGKTMKGVYSKDVILHIIDTVRADGALYKAAEFTGEYVKNASIPSRLTMCNMAIEMGAKNGIIEADQKTFDYLGRKGRAFKSDNDAEYDDEFEIEVDSLEPQVACPSLVDNVQPVTSVEGTEIDQAYIGTCTNGRLEDLEIAAKILKGKKVGREIRLVVIPASTTIYHEAYKRGYIKIFQEAGGVVSNPGCGPCIGRHGGVLAPGEVCITTQNRNFSGRMGHPTADIYLASPATVAISAITGVITDPRGNL